MGYTYIAFYKPFDVLSQFTKEIGTHKTLADYLNIAKDIYPVGRLDRDSEGLLLLTDDKRLRYLGGVHASDHYPVMTEYVWQADGVTHEL